MRTKKILFLDIDGVLNSVDFIKRRYDSGMEAIHWHGINELDNFAVKRLASIVDRTNCKIVISSTWRKLYRVDEIKEMLDSFEYLPYGFPIVDKTPVIHKIEYINGKPVGRGREIQKWIFDDDTLDWDTNCYLNFCIVDDDSDMLPEQSQWFVQTNNQHGLLDEHVERIVEILNK